MKKLLRNLLLLFPTLLTSIFSGYGKIMIAVSIILNSAFGGTNEGSLKFKNYVEDAEGNNNYIQTNHWSESIAPGISEGKDRYDAIGPSTEIGTTSISGPNGIPNKNVDFYDLGAFADDYLQDINDPNTWSRVR